VSRIAAVLALCWIGCNAPVGGSFEGDALTSLTVNRVQFGEDAPPPDAFALMWLTPQRVLLGERLRGSLASPRGFSPAFLVTGRPPAGSLMTVRPQGARASMEVALGVVVGLADGNHDGRFAAAAGPLPARLDQLAVVPPDRVVGVSRQLLFYVGRLAEWTPGTPADRTGATVAGVSLQVLAEAVLGYNHVWCDVDLHFYRYDKPGAPRPGWVVATRTSDLVDLGQVSRYKATCPLELTP
jgi:hypothetical protein